MNLAQSYSRPLSSAFEQLKAASEILASEAATVQSLSKNVPVGFATAVEKLLNCAGSVVVCGMGKAGWIGQKISASLASTGTRSHFLHPAEAAHGDLGRIAETDWMLVLSNSGETEEVVQILPSLQKVSAGIIAITGRPNSTLARSATILLDFPTTRETCHLGLAPSNSTMAMLALGDALALVVSQARQFSPQNFALYHPGGALGKKLSTVDDLMRPINRCRTAHESDIVRDIYVRSSSEQRRSGVILIVNEQQQLTGLFTDSDLARLLERRQDSAFNEPISQVMTHRPISIREGKSAEEAVTLLAEHNISELPVVSLSGHPVGLIDITDVIGLLPVNGP